MASSRAPFIVIEGLDRSGKSTQAAELLTRLNAKGREARLIKFPDRTTAIGMMIDSYLRSASDLDDHAIHLLFSANRWEHAETIENDLKAGKIVLCDRYAFSGCSFSAAKGLDLQWCMSSDVGLPAPDLVLFLDVEPDIARERGGYGQERYEHEDLQKKVKVLFHKLGQEYGERWKVVDAGRSLSEVARCIWKEVTPLLSEKPQLTSNRLWLSP